jgi:hypothetical protein
MRAIRNASAKTKSNHSRKQIGKYLAVPLIGICVSLCSSVAHAARDCMLPSSGYENYDCNKTYPPIPEVKVDTKLDAKRCVAVYRSGAFDRVCYPPKRP